MSGYIIGSDEVGWGAWAGPLYVCAVAAPIGWVPPAGLTDSKNLDADEKLALYYKLQRVPLHIALMSAPNTTIDAVGPKEALLGTHGAALRKLLDLFPDAEVIVDGSLPIPSVPQARCIPRADATYPVVMAASVIAKVNRDFLMRQLHKEYPHYGWDTNVGYGGGKKHHAGLKKYGVTPLHRRCFGPIKKLLEKR